VRKTDLDLVLMDLNMPVMSGNESIKEIRKFNKTIPIIIITASNNINLDDFKEDDVSDFIFKPFNPEDLLKTIKKVFN
ncbi:MAG: response regulator, partial [Polaribacter sp.]